MLLWHFHQTIYIFGFKLFFLYMPIILSMKYHGIVNNEYYVVLHFSFLLQTALTKQLKPALLYFLCPDDRWFLIDLIWKHTKAIPLYKCTLPAPLHHQYVCLGLNKELRAFWCDRESVLYNDETAKTAQWMDVDSKDFESTVWIKHFHVRRDWTRSARKRKGQNKKWNKG